MSTYKSLDNQHTQERRMLEENLRNTQLHAYLGRFFLHNYHIPGIGPERQATLGKFGVKTAADVSKKKIIGIPGFGRSLTRKVLEWRISLENQFVFDISKGVGPNDIQALNQRFSRKRRQIEEELLAGIKQLQQIREQILLQREQMLPTVRTAAQKLAQAEADLLVLK